MYKFTLIFLISLCTLNGFGQQTDTLIKKLDSLSNKTDSAGKQVNNTTEGAFNDQTKLTFKNYFILLASDLKQDFTKPFHMKGKDWKKLGLFALTVSALSFADEPIQHAAMQFRNKNPGALQVSRYVTNFGGAYEFYTLASLGAYGLIFKNEKLKTTTLLASQAYITGAAIEAVLKFLSGRTRPSYYDPAMEAEPVFKGPFKNSSNSSFPSGHTTVAFAAATVYAMEYKSTVWVPILSYSVASLIGVSRITENKHWATDVLAGAVLGYLSGRQIVNNYHRYAKIKAPGQAKNSVSFNVGYVNRQVSPGLVYHIQ